jgi:hypothetical protein
MPDEHHTPTNGVPPVSEPFGNQPPFVSERFGNVRKEDDASFGSFPKGSESFRRVPPSASETLGEILSRPERRPVHTLSAREVEKLFEQAGRPVTERSLLNWCKPNSEGICRLNCGYERGERRWYIAPASVERVIEEERKKDQSFPKDSLEFSEASERLSETFGNERDPASESFGNVRKEDGFRFGKAASASERTGDAFPKASERNPAAAPHAEPPSFEPRRSEQSQTVDERKEIESMRKRNAELEREAAAGEWKDEVITGLRERLIETQERVVEDRKDYNERMKFFQTQIEKLQTTSERYVEELVGINRLVGELKAENRTLRMLPAGNREMRDTIHSESEPLREES